MKTNSLDYKDFVDIAEWQELVVGENRFDIPFDWQGHALRHGPKVLEEIDVTGACNTPEIVNLDGFGRRVARRLTCPHKARRFMVGNESHLYCLDWKHVTPDRSRIAIHAEFCSGCRPVDEAYEIVVPERGPRTAMHMVQGMLDKMDRAGISHDEEKLNQDPWFLPRVLANELSLPGQRRVEHGLRSGAVPKFR
jgi:hypothetical protein